MSSAEVSLHLYDLSQGMARSMSQQLLGIQLDGIWHTGIVFRGKEYFFGGGIFSDRPALTPYGRPDKRLQLGSSTKTEAEFEAFLNSIRPRFRMQDYDLLRHNCNNFTNECAHFLVGHGIPQDIIDLPNRALSSPIGQMLLPQIEQYQQSMVSQYAGIDQSITQNAPHPHAALHVPLFTLGTPIAYTSGALNKAVERLTLLLRESGHAILVTAPIQNLSLVMDAANFAAQPDAGMEQLVKDLVAALQVLSEPNRYPVFDMLRVVCLNARGLDHILASQVILDCLLEPGRSKLSFTAGLRLCQNMLIRSTGRLTQPPIDTATARFIVEGLASEEANIRKGAAYAAYNFAVALSKRQDDDEASTILVLGIAGYLKQPKDALHSFEFLSVILSLGTALYGRVALVGVFRSQYKEDLARFKPSNNAQVDMALDQLLSVVNF